MGFFGNNKNNVKSLYEDALDLAVIDDEGCIRCYDKIIGINSNEGMAWRGKGLALGRLGMPQEAIDCFDKALEIDPYDDLAQRSKEEVDKVIKVMDTTHFEDIPSLVRKGWNLKNDGKYEEAIDCFDKIIEIDPESDHPWFAKGMSLYKLSKYHEALFCYDKAIGINPDEETYWFDKGEILNKLSKYSESIFCYEKGFKINPDYSDNSDWSSDDGTAMQSLDAVKAKLSKESFSKTADKIVIGKSEQLDVLKMRLTKGEITLKEFNQIKDNDFVATLLNRSKDEGDRVTELKSGDQTIKHYINVTNSQGFRVFGTVYIQNKKNPKALQEI